VSRMRFELCSFRMQVISLPLELRCSASVSVNISSTGTVIYVEVSGGAVHN
jgi:hypothetical protein